jgi:hypothetical protein
MADYTEQQLRDAARRAYDDGDVATARSLIARARAAGGTPAPDAAPESLYDRFRQTMVGENLIGYGEVDTRGERLGEFIRGATAATARGLADVPAIPANLAQLGVTLGEKALGMEEPSAASRALASLPDTRDMLAATPYFGPETQYVAPGTAGEYIATAGEFAGGGGGVSRLTNMARNRALSSGANAGDIVRYGVAPGVASEAAGQLTEGSALEPYARTGAALGASLLAAPRAGAFAGQSESARMANVLEDAGVRNVTAGQALGNRRLMGAEGRLQATPQQIDDFTASTMRQLGSAERLATPTNLVAIESRLVREMADATAGITIRPSINQANKAMQLAADYAERVPMGNLTPRVRGIAEEIRALAVSGKSVPLTRLREYRSDIGNLTISSDAATRQAAHALRTLIDDLTDTALRAANRTDDIEKLARAREGYRNFIAVRDAASRAGAEGGTLSPTQLNQSLIRAQGREAYATGRTTGMGDFTRSGAAVLRQAPAVPAGGIRTSQGLGASTGGAIGALVGGTPGALIGGTAGVALPAVGQAAMRSNAMQTLLRNPYQLPRQSVPMLPGLLSQD